MVEKIRLIEERINQLEEIIDKAKNGKGYADIKWCQSLLELNMKIRAQLLQGLTVEFYKLPDPIEPKTERLNKSNFFLTKAQVIESFVGVLN